MEIQGTQYSVWLDDIRQRIRAARLKAALAVNAQLLEVYWELGKEIVQKQNEAGWGDSVLEQLSADLRESFPDMKGFSRRNLYAIRQWYLFYSQAFEFVPRSVAQIPWGHNRLIISKTKNTDEALFYAKTCVENGWTRDQLEVQLRNGYHLSKGMTTNNFTQTLPAPQSQLAVECIRDPYHFDFLGLEDSAQERDIENAMMHHITRFLVEMGKGFAFVGRQYAIAVSDTEYFIDLLFYHLHLRCFVVVELKAGKFRPEYAGKLNFYLSAIDSQLKHPTDNPSIGLILCRTKDSIEAEYSLRDIQKPIGISEYHLTQALPKELEHQLPTVEQLESRLSSFENESPHEK